MEVFKKYFCKIVEQDEATANCWFLDPSQRCKSMEWETNGVRFDVTNWLDQKGFEYLC